MNVKSDVNSENLKNVGQNNSVSKETGFSSGKSVNDFLEQLVANAGDYTLHPETVRKIAGEIKSQIISEHEKEIESEKKHLINTVYSSDDQFYDSYIHSDEFISRFGDWEKANRLEKLKNAPILEKNGKIIIEGEDITEEVKRLRDNNDTKVLRIFAKDIGRIVKGTYHNIDLDVDISLSMTNVDEIKNHHMNTNGHLEAIQYIPEIIENGIYIAEEPNEDKNKHPNIEKYQYLVTGLKLGNVDYTCKSAIGVDKKGNHYYDQRLSEIEKGQLIDNLSQLMSRGKSELPINHHDIRLIRICQCPQIMYLDKNLFPSKEAVEAVRNGTLYIEKDANGIQLLHDTKKNIVIGSELSELLKNHEDHKKSLNATKSKEQKMDRFIFREIGSGSIFVVQETKDEWNAFMFTDGMDFVERKGLNIDTTGHLQEDFARTVAAATADAFGIEKDSFSMIKATDVDMILRRNDEDYDPIEAAEAWQNGTQDEIDAMRLVGAIREQAKEEFGFIDNRFIKSTLTMQQGEDDYINSNEFLSKFGDWYKANRLENLRQAESIKKDEKIILNGSDITATVESLIENEDRKGLQALEKEIGKSIVGTYQNDDTGIEVNVSNRNVTEISNHHYLFKEHIQSIAYIPEIIKKATFIAEVENEDKQKHPNIEKYLYFATGLNIAGEDYTCKSVIGVDSSKNCYYDQSLSTIEKGRLVDYIFDNKKAGNLSPLITQRETDFQDEELDTSNNDVRSSPYVYYDKRLLNICQVPQLPYMEQVNGIWQPTKETIELVKARKLHIEENNIVVAVGVAPTISALRFPEELPATRLRPSATTNIQNLSQEKPYVKSVGEQLAELDSKIWKELGIGTGSDFAGHPEKIKSYASSVKDYLDANGIKELDRETFSFLEAINYHTLNNILGLHGVYGEEFRRRAIERADSPYSNYDRNTALEIVNGIDREEILDKGIERMQENGGVSDSAAETEMNARDNPRADYLDADGNPHWFDEEEEQAEEQEIEEDSPAPAESTITEGNLYPDDVNSATTKLGDIVRETFLSLSDDEKEAGTTTEQKYTRYEKWHRPMIDEIMASVTAGDQDLLRKISDFDLNKASHKEGNSYYSEDGAFKRDVNYKLLPELYEIVQDKIRKEYDEKKIPYIVMFSSESPVFPTENKVYTVKEFNELLLKADSEFYNRQEYAKKKYGSSDNYWELESEDKLPEEDKGIQFGYDKTNFKFFNIPNPANPEDTFSYEPSRYDIGDGNGSVFDDVRSTCSHDEFIEALNQLEKDLYFPEVTKTQREDIDKLVAKEAKKLSKNLTEKMAAVDEAQEEYEELHKKWLIESSEAEAADKKLEEALSGVKAVYDKAMSDAFGKILNEYPYASIKSIEDSQLLQYAANEVKKMAINELYLPSRNAQKAMNAEDYASYNSTNWAKLRKIWALFPANVNMTEYVGQKLEKLCKENGIELNENVVSTSTLEPSQEEISNARKLVRDTQAEIAKKKYESEQGSNYDSNLSTTDIAKKLRDYVKKNYPDYKFSITSKYFSGGSEINVTLKQAPGEITNENIMKEYLEHNSARKWWNKDTGKYEKYYEMTDERKKEVIKDSVDSAYVFNIPSTEENPSWMSPEVNKVMMDVQRELESYNFDHSDSQSDYYNVNFWSYYYISKEAVERSLKITKAPETKAPEKSLNFVLEKLGAAGIEVVQDKAEFDRILNSAEILQKMQEENKVEDLFISKNKPTLDSEIDKLTINDINLQDEFIEISDNTPFVLKECGLSDFPVKMYKQKLARAFFLEVEKYGERITHGHKGEFSVKEVKSVLKNIGNPRYVFNSKSMSNKQNLQLVAVYDDFDKNGDPMILSLRFNKDRKEVEANWVTAVYGKRKNILVNDWTKKGYLVYMNDLELEKAPAEVVTLHMRVSKSASAYDSIIKHKSEFVNDMDLVFYKQNNQIYGFAYNGKIYLDPELMNSEVAVHEYTHLWDNYTMKTNPELWEKGKDVFKRTSLWNEVKASPDYADIADDDNLVLSECHARIAGKVAAQVLEKIAKENGEIARDKVINWDLEVSAYVYSELSERGERLSVSDFQKLNEFIVSPVKDLLNGRDVPEISVIPDKPLSMKLSPERKPGGNRGIEIFSGNVASIISGARDGSLPALPKDGFSPDGGITIRPAAVRSYLKGQVFTGLNQLVAQKKAAELGLEPDARGSINVITYRQAGEKNIRKGTPHFDLTSYDSSNNRMNYYHLYSVKGIIDESKLPPPHKPLVIPSAVIKAEDPDIAPVDYLASYEAATKAGCQFRTNRKTVEAVREKLVAMEKELMKTENYNSLSASISSRSKKIILDKARNINAELHPRTRCSDRGVDR